MLSHSASVSHFLQQSFRFTVLLYSFLFIHPEVSVCVPEKTLEFLEAAVP